VRSDFTATLIEFNGENDHVHLLLEHPPPCNYPVVNSLKEVSPRRPRQRFQLHTHPDHPWSPSHFAAPRGDTTLDHPPTPHTAKKTKPSG